MAGLCCELGITKGTAYDWAKYEDKAEFSDTLSLLKQKQERLLLNGGLSGENNAAITKLMLCNHGYSDKQDNTYSVDVMSPISPLKELFDK